MQKYENGKIYKIVCKTTNLIYVGSTIKTLESRLSRHKSVNKLQSSNITSRKVLENDNYEIILIEKYPCSCREDLHKRERYYIELNDCVNKNIPTRTAKEYRDNPDNNKKIKEYQKTYRDNIDGDKEKYKSKRDYQREYQIKNADKWIGYMERFYQKNPVLKALKEFNELEDLDKELNQILNV